VVYDSIIAIYHLGLRIAANFHPKAKLWVDGRKGLLTKIASEVGHFDGKTVWVHCASLGEFEMVRPIIDSLKSRPTDVPRIILTFYSPSGHEVRKNYSGVDHVFYLPYESKENARRFIAAIRPHVVVFVKYDLWFHFLNAAQEKGSHLILISAQFAPHQYFFRWFGAHGRKCLAAFHHIFVVDDASRKLLRSINISAVTACGDTRYDRVMDVAANWKPIPEVAEFKASTKLIVCGSTWPDDEAVLVQCIAHIPNAKWVIAPHEVHEANTQRLERIFPNAVRFSNYSNQETNVLLVDSIGILAQLYGHADVAYVGGGFGSGLHNILEATAFGIPVIFGPDHGRFADAGIMVNEGLAYSINTAEGLRSAMVNALTTDCPGPAILAFMNSRTGARRAILEYLDDQL